MGKAFYITAGELAQKGYKNIPSELVSNEHLIYSSPATLAYNSPGANGFGVKRAGLAIPGSVMLLVAPACCGRNTALLSRLGYSERFFYLLLDDTDIVTGRHLTKIPKAVKEICEECETLPTAVMICITCVDALLGTDMERVCRKSTEVAGVPVAPCYMYALTREKRLPPMAAVRKSVYSLLKPQKRVSSEMNIMGFFAPLNDDCEIYDLLKSAGIKKIREISRCETFEEYEQMSRANFNLVLNSEARYAAQEMEKALGIPSVELTRMYRLDKIANQYRLLGQALGVTLDDEKYFKDAENAVKNFIEKFGSVNVAVGEILNADSFELSLALTQYGFKVKEIYGTVGERNFVYVKKLAELSPDTKIYSNLSPSMLYYECDSNLDAVIGNDAGYYHKNCPCVDFNEERQPFGYEGVKLLIQKLENALKKEGDK